MRATTLTALTLLAIVSPILSAPLPDLRNSILESHDRASSSIYRPSPHLLPINAPHTPSTATFSQVDSRPSLSGSSSKDADNVSPKELSQHWSEIRSPPLLSAPLPHSAWLMSTPRTRKPCHSTALHPSSLAPHNDAHQPKELAQHWSENRPSEVIESGRWQEVKSWRIVRWRVASTRIVRETVFSEEMLEYTLWILSACLVIAMGLEFLTLFKSRSTPHSHDESTGCECGNESGNLSEKTASFEKEKLKRKQAPQWDDDTESASDIDKNGLESSSW